MIRTTILFLITILFWNNGFSQLDTINAINNKLLTSKLKEGTHTYMVYTEDSLHQKTGTADLWERSAKFVKVNNLEAVKFTWKWYKNDSLLSVTTNISNKKTLAPMYHHVNYKGTFFVAYDYRGGFLIPSDSVVNNYVKDYPKRELKIPVINWEEDLEILPLLPIKNVGQEFCISFFDVNEKEPSYHTYKVVSTDILQLNADTKAACWQLKINYSETNYSLFWLTQKSLEVIKMEEHFDGRYRYKVKLY